VHVVPGERVVVLVLACCVAVCYKLFDFTRVVGLLSLPALLHSTGTLVKRSCSVLRWRG